MYFSCKGSLWYCHKKITFIHPLNELHLLQLPRTPPQILYIISDYWKVSFCFCLIVHWPNAQLLVTVCEWWKAKITALWLVQFENLNCVQLWELLYYFSLAPIEPCFLHFCLVWIQSFSLKSQFSPELDNSVKTFIPKRYLMMSLPSPPSLNLSDIPADWIILGTTGRRN